MMKVECGAMTPKHPTLCVTLLSCIRRGLIISPLIGARGRPGRHVNYRQGLGMAVSSEVNPISSLLFLVIQTNRISASDS